MEKHKQKEAYNTRWIIFCKVTDRPIRFREGEAMSEFVIWLMENASQFMKQTNKKRPFTEKEQSQFTQWLRKKYYTCKGEVL